MLCLLCVAKGEEAGRRRRRRSGGKQEKQEPHLGCGKKQITRFGKPEPKDRCVKWKNTNGYKREDVQKVRTGRFETSKFTSSNVGAGQNKTFRNLEFRILDN